tara:strand:+ start:338 stop:499 length:162 start_codon:yes stop_codon:yes gene_type:complete
MNIGDVIRIKTNQNTPHSGDIGLITGRTGDHYYHVLLESGEFLYADVALEVLC